MNAASLHYVNFALDRMDLKDGENVASLRAEADAMREAAATLEGRARRLPGIIAMTRAVQAAGESTGAI